jgi:hypothetical protein
MTDDRLDWALRALNRRRPFRRFWLELTSGDRILVSHPEVVQRQGELLLHGAPDRGYRIFAADGVCQLIDVPPEAPGT